LVVRTPQIPKRGETTIGRTFQTFFGGKGANQAVGIAKLGYPVSMIGKVGSDSFGDQLLAELTREGINQEAVTRASGPSGIAVITTEDSAENTIIVVPGANGKLRPGDIESSAGVLRSAAMVLTQLEIPMETVCSLAQICQRHDVPLVLDPAPAAELPAELLQCLTWLTPNETELLQLTQTDREVKDEGEALQLAESLMSRGARNILLKLGEKGSYLATSHGAREWIPAMRVIAKDTTAAGDAYNAAFAVALCEGRSAEDAAQFASAAAAISVMREGAQPSLAKRQEVHDFLVKERC